MWLDQPKKTLLKKSTASPPEGSGGMASPGAITLGDPLTLLSTNLGLSGAWLSTWLPHKVGQDPEALHSNVFLKSKFKTDPFSLQALVWVSIDRRRAVFFLVSLNPTVNQR